MTTQLESPFDDDFTGDMCDVLKWDSDKVLEERERLGLLQALYKKGLATRDVLSFIENQADQRSTNKFIDAKTCKSAMRAKINDSKETLKSKQLTRRQSIKRFKNNIGGKGYKLKKTLNAIRRRQETLLKKLNEKNDKKIKHLHNKMDELNRKYETGHSKNKFRSSKVPERLKEYGGLSIFGTPKDLPVKQDLSGPFICHPSIVLSDGEMAILSRDPKFSIMKGVNKLDFLTEIERGLTKHRFNEHMNSSKLRKKKKGSIKVDFSDCQADCGGKIGKSEQCSDVAKPDGDYLLGQLWEDESHSYVYDPFNKEVDFSKRRPTDYKLNSRIILPKPLPIDGEFQCEVRKRSYLHSFDEYNQMSKKCQNTNNNDEEKSEVDVIIDNVRGKKKAQVETRARKDDDILNLSKIEKVGLSSIKKRMKNKEIIVTPTDKSGRFSIMTYNQYLEAGHLHTDKDEEMDWDGLRYLKNQVNGHMWWLSKMWSYAKHTDPDRMLKNLTVSDIDLPEMSLLTKDHKSWSSESNKPVPTRPVMSGNCAINTHLSELISELVEPMALEFDGSEVQSSEEILARIDQINNCVNINNRPPVDNVLGNFESSSLISSGTCEQLSAQRGNRAQPADSNGDNNNFFQGQFSDLAGRDEENDDGRPDDINDPMGMSLNNKNVKHHLQNLLPNDLDQHVEPEDQPKQTLDSSSESVSDNEEDLVDLLADLVHDSNQHEDLNDEGDFNNKKEPTLKTKITDFFSRDVKFKMDSNDNNQTTEWLGIMVNSARDRYNSSKGTLNDRLTHGIKAGDFWGRLQSLKTNQVLQNSEPVKQDMEGKPVLFGCDVVGLYPNLDPISVAHVTAQAVKNTKIKFKAVNFYYLIIYLVLVLGVGQMEKMGLGQCIVKKKKKNNINSLAATSNRDLDTWDFSGIELNDKNKKDLIAATLQIMILLLTSTTCYKFGGKLYRQRSGLGIGLRGSAALARLVMCTWDRSWGYLHYKLGLVVQLFCRYVDDIRLYLRPLLPGYRWTSKGWQYTQEADNRTPVRRTLEELNKALNDCWTFLEFTTEQEGEFSDDFLPTLDFATQVQENGYIKYKFFRKPMSSNMVLQKGTALSNGCVFSSLRQDLVRRLYNSDLSMGVHYRLSLIEEFIQLLVNSDHKFSFIKSVILQAVTKFLYMVERSRLHTENKRYSPLHRLREFKSDERKLIKYTNRAVWYTRIDVKDKYRNTWKGWIRRKGQMRNNFKSVRRNSVNDHKGYENSSNRPLTRGALRNMNRVTTALFVPKTPKGHLAEMIQLKEDRELVRRSDWTVKVLEKPGIQLAKLFIYKFVMDTGCWRGDRCICKGQGNMCTAKGVVYEAKCMTCYESPAKIISTYVGETARQVGTRALEHLDKARLFKTDSFIIEHWMLQHPVDTRPPRFQFKVSSKHKDALSRQVREALQIKDQGNLNRRNEFSINEIIKLESSRYSWDAAEQFRVDKRESDNREKCLNNFVDIMHSVSRIQNIENIENMPVSNSDFCYRHYNQIKRKSCEGSEGHQVVKKLKAMDSSTPFRYREEAQDPITPPDSSPIHLNSDSELGSNDCVITMATNHTNLSQDASAMKIKTDDEPESLVDILAGKVIAAEDVTDAQLHYCKRTGVLHRTSLRILIGLRKLSSKEMIVTHVPLK